MSNATSSFDTRRLLRLYVLIAFVTAVFFLTAREVVAGPTLSIALVVIGSVALVSAITGFLIAAAGAAQGVGE